MANAESTTELSEEKECTLCKTAKPLSAFTFQRRRNQYTARCNRCQYEVSKPTAEAYRKRKNALRKPPEMIGRYRKLPELSPEDRERFYANIQVNEPDECWPWIGDRYEGRHGPTYGKFSIDGVKWRAHRIAWFLAKGEDPGEELLRHEVCENPPCCNIAHLSTGDQDKNAQDAKAHGRIQSGDNHWSRRNPEKIPRGPRPGNYARGDQHYSALHPELVVRGDKHYSKLHPERVARGEATGYAILKDAEVLTIRSEWAARATTQRQLAARFKVSTATISLIVNRKIWTHL